MNVSNFFPESLSEPFEPYEKLLFFAFVDFFPTAQSGCNKNLNSKVYKWGQKRDMAPHIA
jgi:hypothetical protein